MTGTLTGVLFVCDLSSQVDKCMTKVGEGVTVMCDRDDRELGVLWNTRGGC